MLFSRDLAKHNLHVCRHLRLPPSPGRSRRTRLTLLFDDGKFTTIELPKAANDPLRCQATVKRYEVDFRLKEAHAKLTAPAATR